MKTFAFAVVALGLFANVALANATQLVEVATHVTCQQDDGDLWYEAGIVPTDIGPGYHLVVVEHNVDNDSSKVISETLGFLAETNGDVTRFEDEEGGELVFNKRTMEGSFSVELPSGEEFLLDPAVCYLNSTILVSK